MLTNTSLLEYISTIILLILSFIVYRERNKRKDIESKKCDKKEIDNLDKRIEEAINSKVENLTKISLTEDDKFKYYRDENGLFVSSKKNKLE